MKRDWVDPRDGQGWVITMLPFGYRGSPASTPWGSERVTIAFHRPGETPFWTPCDPPARLDRLEDRMLMAFLDRATRTRRDASLLGDGPGSAAAR